MLERRVLVEQIEGGDVIHAGVAEDVIRCLGVGDGMTALADHNPKLAFEHHPPGIILRPGNFRAAGKERCLRLEEIKRFGRFLVIELGCERVKIVPQANHLARIARRREIDLRPRKHAASRSRRGEHIAGMNGDALALKCAEAQAALLREANPLRHDTLVNHLSIIMRLI